MISKIKLEQDLAKIVIDNLTEQGYEIYQEVVGIGGRCDIVAKKDHIIWAIECKLSFNLSLIEQAYNWRYQANYVSVAVPSGKIGEFRKKICNDYGIGILSVMYGSDLYEISHPKLFRKIKPLELCEEQKYYCSAGTSSGGYYTPFRKTVNSLVGLVNRRPGIEFGEAIKTINYHYGTFSTAKSCLRGYIGTVISELRTEIVNGKLCLFINEER